MRRWFIVGIVLALGPAAAHSQQNPRYSIDPAKSRFEIHVYREGLFKFLGHDHLVVAKDIAGMVELDQARMEGSGVHWRAAAASLTVVDPGVEAKERGEVQQTMESDKVLDVRRFPEITFASTRVSQVKKTATGYALVLAGKLNLHGVEHGVEVPVHVGIKDNELEARSETFLLQTSYGIAPVRVAGGTIKVKDRLKITFDIIAVRRSAAGER